MSEELQEVIDRRALWTGYEISSNEQAKSIIKNNINQMCNNWISIGFVLKQARNKEFYKEDGYSCIQDYAFGEFGIKKQRASKLIKIIETLSVNGNSPVLEDKWKEFSIAKLEEIIYLDEEDRESVQPVMTKVQIRNIGKDDSTEVSPAKLESEVEPRIKNAIIRAYIDSFPDWKKDNIRKAFSESRSLQDRIDYIRSCTALGQIKLTFEGEEKKILYLRKSSDTEVELSDWLNEIEVAPGVMKLIFSYAEIAGLADGMLYEQGPEQELDPYDAKKPEPGTIIYCVGGGGSVEKYETVSKYSDFSPKYFNAKDKSGTIHNISAESEHWHYSREEAKKDSWYREKKSGKPKTVNDTPEIVNDVDEDIIPERGCHNCNYNGMTPEEFKAIDPDGGLPCNACDDKLDQWVPKIDNVKDAIEKSDFPCDTCGHDINGCCDYDDESDWCELGSAWILKEEEPEQVETVEADIIQTVPEEPEIVDEEAPETIDYEKYSGIDVKEEMSRLTEYVEAFRKNNDIMPGRRKAKMRLDAIILLDKEMRKPPVVEPPKQVQPELPILKNNDQRKTWAENYKAWGEWYYDEHINCHYYKYDFPGGDRLIVEEYQGMIRYWNRNEKYDQAHYHLCIKQKTDQWIKIPYEQRYEHSTTNMTEIVEYLKDIQKKGA